MKFRYVRKDRKIYPDSHCRLCGTCHGVVRPEVEHKGTTCKLCNARQCSGNGLGRGCCPICYVGLLTGWAGTEGICSYKNCGKEGVARGKQGKRFVCLEHALKQNPNVLIDAKINLETNWMLVEESPNSPYA